MKPPIKRHLVSALSAGLFLVLLFYNSCQGSLGSKGFSSARYSGSSTNKCPGAKASTPVIGSPADFRPPSFADQKLRLRDSSEPTQQKAVDLELPAGTPLVAVVNNICVAESDSKTPLLTSILVDQTLHSELPTQALQWKLDRNYLESELDELINAEPCFIGVSWHKEYSLSSLTFNDTSFGLQTHLSAIKAAESYMDFFDPAFGIKIDSSPGVIVAVLDTGVDLNHPDLRSHLWSNAKGFGVDATTINNVTINYNPTDVSTIGHGTHVSGIIGAASNNGIGIVGTMPYNVQIMPIRVFQSNNGQLKTLSDFVYNGILYAVQNGAKVINLSLASTGTGPGSDPVVESAIDYALSQDVTVITVLGNSDSTYSAQAIDGTNFHSIPAQFAIKPGVLGVGSFDSNTGSRSTFSHYGLTYGEIAAPGAEQGYTGIYSTVPASVSSSNYGRLAGTSQAGPQVSAAAALAIGLVRELKGSDPTAAEVENLLLSSAAKSSVLTNYFQSGNRLDLQSLATKIKNIYKTSTVSNCP